MSAKHTAAATARIQLQTAKAVVSGSVGTSPGMSKVAICCPMMTALAVMPSDDGNATSAISSSSGAMDAPIVKLMTTTSTKMVQ